MRETDTNSTPPLIAFPCTFPIKVMGKTHGEFATTMVTAIQVIVPEFSAEHVDMRASSGGKYISLTCRVYVMSQQQLDDVYRMLTAHPMVKFAL
jgi:uncharacterized protein